MPLDGYRLKLAIEYLKREGLVRSQKEVAEKMGTTPPNVSSAVNGVETVLTKSFLQRFNRAFNYQFNEGWLIDGEGDMLLSNISVNETSSLPKKRIPFYDDVATIGGTNRQVADVSSNGSVSEWIDAGDWFPEATAAIRHYGDSMIEYPSGSILALKRVEDWRLIIWGRNYSIETTEFRITKRLQDGGNDYILAYSSNTDTYPDGTLIHSPIKIPKDAIRHIDLVLGCVTKEYSNGPIKIVK